MLRASTVAALAAVMLAAFAVYAINYDTRRIDAEVQALERAVERTANEIAVLKAERAYLARPERIEPLARIMGLRPAEQRQIASDLAGAGGRP